MDVAVVARRHEQRERGGASPDGPGAARSPAVHRRRRRDGRRRGAGGSRVHARRGGLPPAVPSASKRARHRPRVRGAATRPLRSAAPPAHPARAQATRQARSPARPRRARGGDLASVGSPSRDTLGGAVTAAVGPSSVIGSAPAGASPDHGAIGTSTGGIGTDGSSTRTFTPPAPRSTATPCSRTEVPEVDAPVGATTGGSGIATVIGAGPGEGRVGRRTATVTARAGAGDSAAPVAADPRTRRTPAPPRTTSDRITINAQRRGVTRSGSPRKVCIPPRRVVETCREDRSDARPVVRQ